MWILFALVSACLLGLYDVFKKQSLKQNAVIPVLFLNCIICSLFFLPMIIFSHTGGIPEGSSFHVPEGDLHWHILVIIKAFIVLSSWICGYFAIKHLPLTIVGPINATRPVMTLIGALIIFGEKLNAWQWAGVTVAIIAYFLLRRSGRKEGIKFSSNHWIWLIIAAAVLGALSGLYDKYLIATVGINRFFVQGWYNLYQSIIMGVITLILWMPMRKKTTPFTWKWTIPFISIFLTAADLAYLYALTFPGAMISVVSMVRRSSVIVSFTFGALLFHEKNLKGKVVDLILVIISLVLLLIGTL
ncbi:MAG: EamA family transporter [Bacteroidales bacterium]|nr:EamA family transporter [Bacteroidales bacterium]MBQ6577555.1 EamA family transporter [Bacteroidales bacterium]